MLAAGHSGASERKKKNPTEEPTSPLNQIISLLNKTTLKGNLTVEKLRVFYCNVIRTLRRTTSTLLTPLVTTIKFDFLTSGVD